MSAASEAALGQLGLIERNDLATMAIAKVIIGLGGRFARPGPRGLTLVVTEQVVENAQASALLENSGLKPTLRRVALSGIAAEKSLRDPLSIGAPLR
jgi:hypothetical protein